MNNWRKFVVLPVLLATVLFGTLYAQVVPTVNATVTAQSGGSALVQSWTVGFPSWAPIEGTVGKIKAGGIVYVGVPAGGASPSGTWTIAVYLKNPAELNEAYSFLNMGIEVQKPLALMHAWDGTMKHSDLLNPDKGYVVFEVESVDGLPGKLGTAASAAELKLTVTATAALVGDLTVTVTRASGGTTEVVVAVADRDAAGVVAASIQRALAANATVAANYTVTVAGEVVTLTAKAAGAGGHAIALTNAGTTGVTAEIVTTDGKAAAGTLTAVDAANATLRIFSVGVAEGSFYTKSVTAGDLTPSFSVEVRGR